VKPAFNNADDFNDFNSDNDNKKKELKNVGIA
jgi:hypothetical protein